MVPKYFKLHNETYRVAQKQLNQTSFKEGFAYLLSKYNDYVYPYNGEISSVDEAVYVGLYVCDDKPIIVRPRTPEEKALYSKSRIIELTPDCVFKNLSDIEIDPSIENAINNDGDIFKPVIKQGDDLMLAGMKNAIAKKHINFNNYSHKFTDMATKNNGRRALVDGRSLKCDMADRFCDVFDLNYAIVFYDSYGARNPMDPKFKTAYYVCNNEPINFSDPEMKFVEVQRNQQDDPEPTSTEEDN